jgi:dCTP deaminase
MKVGQFCFFKLSSPAVHPYGEYGNRYQGQRGPTASRSHENFYRSDLG